MRVALDDRQLSDPGGIGRYVRCLTAALAATATTEDEVVPLDRARTADVLHAPAVGGAHLRCHLPQVVSVGELTALSTRRDYLRVGHRLRLRYLAVQRADAVIVPTPSVAEDVERLLGVPGARIHVVPQAAAPAFRPRAAAEVADVRERLGLPERFLLWAGELSRPNPRKRVGELAQAPRSLPVVLAGRTGAWARELPGVHLTGELDDEDLAAVYSAAHALVLPSEYEGSGLTALEALACGCPVACSDLPGLRESIGPRGVFAPPDDVAGIVAAAETASRPTPPPVAWSWESAALVTWGVYREVASQRSRRSSGVLSTRRRLAG